MLVLNIKMQFYTYVDYPIMPKDLSEVCLNYSELSLVGDTSRYKIEGQKYHQYILPDSVKEWLFDTKIMTLAMTPRLHVMSGSSVYPHIDYGRNTALNYILSDDGGTTCWYNHKTDLGYSPKGFSDFIKFEEVDQIYSVKLEQNRWHILDTATLHGVVDIASPRIAITSLNESSFRKI